MPLFLKRSISLAMAAGILALAAQGAAAASWKFAVVGDSRSGSATTTNGVNVAILGEIANSIKTSGAELLLVPGDLFYANNDATAVSAMFDQWKTTMAPVYNAGIKVYPTTGNHEYALSSTTMRNLWRQKFPELLHANTPAINDGPSGEEGVTYSLAYKNAFFAVLDGNDTVVSQSWLNTQLATVRNKATQPFLFATEHHPALEVNHTDCLDDHTTERNAFLRSLLNNGGNTYFSGHDHMYDHSSFNVLDDSNNVLGRFDQFVVGGGGAGNTTWDGAYSGQNTGLSDIQHVAGFNNYGYEVVTVNDDGTYSMVHYKRTGTNTFVPADAFAPKVGDTNMDGTIDFDDYLAIDAAYRFGKTAIWTNGDFNRDYVINSDDYVLMDQALLAQNGLGAADMIFLHASWFGPDYLSNFPADLPEPASLGLLGVGAAGLLMRRRRN